MTATSSSLPAPPWWPAPAKLNLFLHVVGRRADGYHLLQTVFQFLDYGDELAFHITDDGRITRARPVPDVPESSDLTLRAARLLQRASGGTRGVDISIGKRVPVGSGLGGGSSDAATTLLALNQLWQTDWTTDRLTALGLELGADVPVFIRGQAAWAEGVGERLTPIDLAETWYVVLHPGISVATADAFAGLQLTAYSPAITIRDFLAGRATRNDLETSVCQRHPEVGRALAWLRNFGAARMTGSGGCVFLEVTDANEGKRIIAQVPDPFSGFIARTMNRHPLWQADR